MNKNNYLMHLTVEEFETVQAKLNSRLIENALQQVQSHIQPAQQELLTNKQTSEMTGYKVNTLYSLVNKRKIPFIKRANSKFLRFNRSEILKWMQSGINEHKNQLT
jgi:predicted DNA-binding transcriptional regulator AlpA